MKVLIIADCREDFPSIHEEKHYNDHYSKKSVSDIKNSICDIGYDCDILGGIETLSKSLYHISESSDKTIFFNLSDGLTQKNRRMQAPLLLELMNAKYIGSDPFVVGVVNNKYFTNKFLKVHNITVPDALIYDNWADNHYLNYPVVIKPNDEGSSIGISQMSICHNDMESKQRILYLIDQDYTPIIEKYISGYEITNFIIGNKDNILLNELILSKYKQEAYFEEFVFGHEEKCSEKRNQMVLTNNTPFVPVSNIKKTGQRIFKILGLQDFARIDFRVTLEAVPVCIEVNSLPVISKTSEIGTICNCYGYSLSHILELIINTAKERMKMY